MSQTDSSVLIINISFEPYGVSGSRQISDEIELKTVAGTKLSVFVWESINNPKPVGKAVVYDFSK